MPNKSNSSDGIGFRAPTVLDAASIHDLIAACPPLDTNSMYANLLQCTHFAETCLIAEKDGELAGWVSGYRLPRDPETYFLWQIAVSRSARGLGLGKRLVRQVLARPGAHGAKRLMTTVTADNDASMGLFRSLANEAGASIERAPLFEREPHFRGRHDTEYLLTIEPLPLE